MNGEVASDALPVARQKLLGRRNYALFFNAQLKDGPEDTLPSTSYVKDMAKPASKGARWKTSEKLRFFKLLSRHSIHNLDVIEEALGKNKFDILNYYHTLQYHLKKVKRKKRSFHRLMRMDEFPIAYEMSSSFIMVEEMQARRLCASQNEHPPPEFDLEPAQDGSEEFIDVAKAKMVFSYYSKFLTGKNQFNDLCYVEEVHNYVKGLCKLMIKNVLMDVLIREYHHRILNNQSAISVNGIDDNGVFFCSVRNEELAQSFGKLYGPRLYTMEEHWNFLPKRLGLEVLNDNEEPVTQRSYNHAVTPLLKYDSENSWSWQDRDIIRQGKDYDPNSAGSSVNSDEENSDPQGEMAAHNSNDRVQNALGITSIYEHLRAKRRKLTSGFNDSAQFVEDERHPIIDDAMAMSLFMKESNYLNNRDLKESRYHEHIVLTFLSTAGKPSLIRNKRLRQTEEFQSHLREARARRPTKDEYELYEKFTDSEAGELDESNEPTPEMMFLQLHDFPSYR